MQVYGIPALDLWNLVIEVFHYTQNQSNQDKDSLAQGDLLHRVTSSKRTKNQTKAPTTHDNSDLFLVDNLFSDARFSLSIAMLYVFEDNEAVIKMIIKGRSPTMRHVSRTRRVSVDCSFDRINLDPKIQIKYIDTKNQLADMLLKASSRQVGLSGRLDASTNQNSNPDAASSSQGWQRDAQLFTSTGRLVATDKDQKSLNRQEKSVINAGSL